MKSSVLPSPYPDRSDQTWVQYAVSQISPASLTPNTCTISLVTIRIFLTQPCVPVTGVTGESLPGLLWFLDSVPLKSVCSGYLLLHNKPHPNVRGLKQRPPFILLRNLKSEQGLAGTTCFRLTGVKLSWAWASPFQDASLRLAVGAGYGLHSLLTSPWGSLNFPESKGIGVAFITLENACMTSWLEGGAYKSASQFWQMVTLESTSLYF